MNSQHEGQEPEGCHEEPLYIALRRAEKEKNSGYRKARKYFSKWKNWVSIATLIFVAVYTVVSCSQLTLLRSTTKRQLRAYVGITGEVDLECLDCGISAKAPDKNSEFAGENVFSIEIQNFGLTPAYELRSWVKFWDVPFNTELPKDFSYSNKDASESSGNESINPGQKIPILDRLEPADRDKISKARNRTVSLYIYGEIEFRDVFGSFGRNRAVFYCLRYMPDLGERSFATCPDHNGTKDR